MKIKQFPVGLGQVSAWALYLVLALWPSGNVFAARCCSVVWDNKAVKTCEGDPSPVGIECARGWDWNSCKCIGATGSVVPRPRTGETPIRIGTPLPPGTPPPPVGIPAGGQQLPPNSGTLVCGCYGATNALGQLRANASCASGYDKILACLGQCQDNSIPYGALCYDAVGGQTVVPTSGVLPASTGTITCGCHGSTLLWQSRFNAACASGYEMIMPCLGQCSPGGVPWGARCL